MNRLMNGALAAVLVFSFGSAPRAEDKPNTILDKAVDALGGARKLASIKAATWAAKGKINLGGNESDFSSRTTVEGLDHVRYEFEGEFNGAKVKGVTVLAGDKGWRQIPGVGQEPSKEELANEKRNVMMQAASMMPSVLKDKGFKIESVGEERVGDKAAVGLKVTGPEGKDFKLYFDKATGVPVRLAAKVTGFGGEMVDQETTFGDYKDFNGIKRATKIEVKRGGEKFMSQNVTDFRVLDSVPAGTFSEPK